MEGLLPTTHAKEATMAQAVPYSDQLAHLKTYIGKMAKKHPEAVKAFTGLHKASMQAGALDSKTKELMALAIAVATHCDDCIAYHVHDALKAGAGEAEVMETLGVAVMMGGGPALMYATHAVEAMEQFTTA
jgi:AhpD family alkylhydroperoxidase